MKRWMLIGSFATTTPLTIACQDSNPLAGGGTETTETEGDASGSETGDPFSDDPWTDCEVTPGRVGLQRLTRSEYNRTVFDLFGVDSSPADAFPPDSTTSSFDNNAGSLTASPQLVELLLDASEDVAAVAMSTMSDQIVTCDPDQTVDCARSTLAALALRVYRRPPSPTELGDLEALVEFAQGEGETFEASIGLALVGMLMSPQFLYRNVPGDGAAPLGPGQILGLTDYEVASRLSYFLWGSTPDDSLLARAGEGNMGDREVLRAEFDRMLADPKAAALFDGFFNQWLQLGRLDSATPDAGAFPLFSEQLRTEMREEMRLFFKGVRDRDATALEFITGTQTFANASIAEIYEATGPTGAWFEPTMLNAERRAGVLTMPAILTMTSGPTSPNIVRRGVWLAEAILCAAPPPPAAGVPAEPVPLPGETERERLERHREDPSCASCHELIDPLGFTFENYDAIGMWRETADGLPVDNTGKLPGGEEFAGIVAMAQELATTDAYPKCITKKMMTYALGRSLGDRDTCVVSAIAQDTVNEDAGFSDLLWAVVTSDAFLSRAGEE
ncbi:MAG: DUF1592 domain-containing protein [Nannocystales bacterium]